MTAAAAQASRSSPPPEPYIIARIATYSDADRAELVDRGLDLLEHVDGDDRFILTTEAEIALLRRDGWHVDVDAAQTSLLLQPQQSTTTAGAQSTPNRATIATFQGGYRTVTEMRAFVNDRAAGYPQLAQTFVYGKSWQGRELFGIKLTNRQRSGSKPVLFVVAAVHAREIATPEIALRFVDDLLVNYGRDGDATWLLDEHLIVVVPVANPDGHLLAAQGYL